MARCRGVSNFGPRSWNAGSIVRPVPCDVSSSRLCVQHQHYSIAESVFHCSADLETQEALEHLQLASAREMQPKYNLLIWLHSRREREKRQGQEIHLSEPLAKRTIRSQLPALRLSRRVELQNGPQPGVPSLLPRRSPPAWPEHGGE